MQGRLGDVPSTNILDNKAEANWTSSLSSAGTVLNIIPVPGLCLAIPDLGLGWGVVRRQENAAAAGIPAKT